LSRRTPISEVRQKRPPRNVHMSWRMQTIGDRVEENKIGDGQMSKAVPRNPTIDAVDRLAHYSGFRFVRMSAILNYVYRPNYRL
jgi:hypothetical protein